jgi:hypothetical protein
MVDVPSRRDTRVDKNKELRILNLILLIIENIDTKYKYRFIGEKVN